ncbi:flagellar biosynthesis anti-sigma factor FlgM [Pseudomonas sp. QL9]|uniref:flagellar biosynthesis anti-sigma factor FlgM n=1 Tax=Pseudomonas sp. QL9 TaxID=3242725 RepID=UPI00352B155C
MEITRQLKPALGTPVQTAATSRASTQATAQGATSQATGTAATLPVEQLQDALGALPDVDLDKVAAIRDALARGEISLDPEALSRSMLDFHGGGA